MIRELTMDKLIEFFVRKWYVILITTVIFGFVTFVYSTYFIEYQYTSTGTMIVTNSQDSKSEIKKTDLDTSARLVETYRILLTSTKFCEMLSDKFDNKYSAGYIKSKLSLTSVNGTEILSVKATTSDQELSQKLVQSVLDNAQQEINSVSEAYNVKVIDNATYPLSRSYPNISYNTFLGALIGLILSIVCGLIISMFDNKLKDEEELKLMYNFPSLGAIPNIHYSSKKGVTYGDGGTKNANI